MDQRLMVSSGSVNGWVFLSYTQCLGLCSQSNVGCVRREMWVVFTEYCGLYSQSIVGCIHTIM